MRGDYYADGSRVMLRLQTGGGIVIAMASDRGWARIIVNGLNAITPKATEAADAP